MISDISIRFAEISDLPSIVDIYNQAIRSRKATGDMTEFTIEQRIEWFKKFDTENYPIYVAEQNNNIVAYATLSPYRGGRAAMRKIGEISFFIDYSFHNLGIGTALVKHIITDCKRLGKEFLVALLLDINPASIFLLKKFGFEEWGRLPKVIDFDDSKCDHLIYGRKL